jgi:CRISPR/Cas system CSM-associated protein Csm3 (group 7 of RAMP superfamily)
MTPKGRDADRRAVVARWVITGTLETTTASQIGSQEGDVCDVTFGRTPDGQAFLPGSTLAGALRSSLSDRRAGYRHQEPAEAGLVFGNLQDRESPVIVFDSFAELPAAASIRDGLRIDPCTGTADEHYKYDRELALPGVRFPIRVDVVVTEGLNEVALLGCLADALDGLSDGSVRLGARKSRGLGACIGSGYRARRFRLDSREGWERYAASDPVQPTTGLPEHPGVRDALTAVTDSTIDLAGLARSGPDERSRATFEFALAIDGTMLIRAPGTAADDPDAVHLTEQGHQLLSGTSLAGVLRSHAGRILNTLQDLGLLKDTAVTVEALFGSWPTQGASDKALQASRVLVTEAQVCDNRLYRQSRVKIDRFTGGAIDQALFEEQPCVGGSVAVQVDILDPTPAEIGLMALVARDLCEGLLPLGGGAAVGRGVLKGNASVRCSPDGKALPLSELQKYLDALANQPKDAP